MFDMYQYTKIPLYPPTSHSFRKKEVLLEITTKDAVCYLLSCILTHFIHKGFQVGFEVSPYDTFNPYEIFFRDFKEYLKSRY